MQQSNFEDHSTSKRTSCSSVALGAPKGSTPQTLSRKYLNGWAEISFNFAHLLKISLELVPGNA